MCKTGGTDPVEERGAGGVPAALRPLAHALAAARTVEEVADALVRHGMPAVGACVAVLALRADDGAAFYCPRVEGYPGAVAAAWRRFPADAPVPIAEAVRTGRPVLLATAAARAAYYPPDFSLPPPVGRALAAIPLAAGG